MCSKVQLEEYMAEIRQQVCSGCIEKPADAPPCGAQGKQCGIELHLQEIVQVAHAARGKAIDPYIEKFHEDVCSHCDNQPTYQCPCPLDYLLLLAIESIEAVDKRHQESESETGSADAAP